ncbi:unnamed protein product [Orchesella dallaii]|uniref:Cytochrome P450 4aa1 n=1 Tax=Orchesella dallaii TaxID=48710 RepID=A0ABP1RYJ2_9HEXA
MGMGTYSSVVDVAVPAPHSINIQNGLIACFTTALFVYYCNFVRKSKRNKQLDDKTRRRKIPGPGQHFLGAVANILALRDETKALKVIENWCERYGPVFQLNFGPYNVTALNCPEYVQKLLGSKDTNHLSKGFIYKPFHAFWYDGILTSAGEKWKSRRRILEKHMFSFKTLVSYMDIFNEQGDTLVQAIEERLKDEKEVGLCPLLLDSSLNSIINAIFGKRLPDLESSSNAKFSFMEGMCRAKELMAKRIMTPYLLNDLIYKLHPFSKVQKFLNKLARKHVITGILDESVEPLMNHDEQRRHNILKRELAAAGVSLEGIYEETMTLLGAGFDTTAHSIDFLLFFLALHPHHQKICRDEVDVIFEDVDLCTSGALQFQALSKLKHLEMCVYETLRLLPAVFLIMRKIDAPLQLEEDLEIPAGSEVAVFVPGLHKNPKYFPDPDKFIPERFSPEQSNNRHPYVYIPFAAGPRKCVGYKFAMMEMLSLTAKLLRSFEWETTDRFEDVVFLPHITYTPKTPINFLFKKRSVTNN